jgi:predicted kinase
MNEVYIMSGISGSGKSTWVNNNMTEYEYINADSIRAEICDDASDQSQNNKVFSLLFSRFRTALYSSKDIVVDNTSLTFNDREKYYDMIPPNFKINLVYFKPDFEKAIKQNQMRERKAPNEVITRQFNRIQGPTQWERNTINVIEI